MAKIRGKQLDSGTISQENLGLVSPEASTDATTKEYTDSLILDSISVEKITDQNQDMTALDTSLNSNTSGIGLACNTPVLEDSVLDSSVEVYINGIRVSVGEGKECFFSPDGILIRLINDTRIGDKLYWDSVTASYDLDTTDSIDFKYLTNDKLVKTVDLAAGGTVNVLTTDEVVSAKFTGVNGETATLNIDGTSFLVGLVADQFVFNIGGGQEYTFSEVTDYYVVIVNDNSYSIRWDGIGSAYFSVVIKADPTKIYGPVFLRNEFPSDIGTEDVYKNLVLYIKIFNNQLYITESNPNTSLGNPNSTSFRIYDKNPMNNKWELFQELEAEHGRGDDYYTSWFDVDLENNKMVVEYNQPGGNGKKINLWTRSSNNEEWEKDIAFTEMVGSSEFYKTAFIYNGKMLIKDRFYSSSLGRVRTFYDNGSSWVEAPVINGTVPTKRFGQAVGFLQDSNTMMVNNINSLIQLYTWNGTSWDYDSVLSTNPTGNAYVASDPIINEDRTILTLMNYDKRELLTWELTTSGWEPLLNHYPPLDDIIGTSNELSTDAINIINNKVFLGLPGKGNIGYGGAMLLTTTNDTWEILTLPKPQIGLKLNVNSIGKYAALGDDGTMLISTWTGKGQGLYEYGYTKANDFPNSRSIKPCVTDIKLDYSTIRRNSRINIEYEYNHPFNIAEGSSTAKWYTRENFSDSRNPVTQLTRNSTNERMGNDLLGKIINVDVTISDNYGNLSEGKGKEIFFLVDDDNSLFGADNIVQAQVAKLTIISGSIGNIGPGTYYIKATRGPYQYVYPSTGTILFGGSSYSFTGDDIYLWLGCWGSSGSYNISVNSSSTSGGAITSTLGHTMYILPNEWFKSYTVGGCTFTIEKEAGWQNSHT